MHPEVRALLDLALPEMRDYALILLDARGRVVGWLCGAEQILGYTAEEMIGQPLAALFVDEDRAKGIDAYELELAAHKTFSQDDRWHVRKDGSRIWITGTVTALEAEGELRGFVKVMQDRTDLRMASEARASELAQVREEIAGLREFARTLGHELRNPLTPIKHASVLLPRLTEEPRVHRMAETIANQVAVLERLAADLMDVSRLETGSLKLRLGELDACELLREETAAQTPSATAKGLKLEAVLPRHPILIRADADRLRQAVGNLLANAIKYTPEGGSIWVKATQEGDDVALRVQDTGIGIDAASLPRIFELFTQERRARDAAPGGLGVGLSIVRHIARLHGGLVQARSGGVGRGSEFTLRLPKPPRTPGGGS